MKAYQHTIYLRLLHRSRSGSFSVPGVSPRSVLSVPTTQILTYSLLRPKRRGVVGDSSSAKLLCGVRYVSRWIMRSHRLALAVLGIGISIGMGAAPAHGLNRSTGSQKYPVITSQNA